jgi:hypothetical protein
MKIPAVAGTPTLHARREARRSRGRRAIYAVAAAAAGTMLTKVRLALPLVLNWTLPSTSANSV